MARRSVLYMPGANERALEKARSLPADALILDLEDAVAPDSKVDARKRVCEAVGSYGDREVAIRVNGLATKWWRDDLRAALTAQADVVVVPKVESAADVAAFAGLLPEGVGLEVQIETARGLVEVERIAAAPGPLEALVFGPGDFAASLGVPVLTIGAGASEYALARIAVAARAHGLQAVDGPYAALHDDAALRGSAERALALGYDGKWVIHPDQIATVNAVFTPSPDAVARARSILAATDGASALEGEMVDAATKRLAESVLARASEL